jgi:hypothetical protein
VLDRAAAEHKSLRQPIDDLHFTLLSFVFDMDIDRDPEFAPMKGIKQLQLTLLRKSSLRHYICEQLLPDILKAVGDRRLGAPEGTAIAGAGAADDPILKKGSSEQKEAIASAYEAFLQEGKHHRFHVLPRHWD